MSWSPPSGPCADSPTYSKPAFPACSRSAMSAAAARSGSLPPWARARSRSRRCTRYWPNRSQRLNAHGLRGWVLRGRRGSGTRCTLLGALRAAAGTKSSPACRRVRHGALQHDLLQRGPASIKESVQSIGRCWSVDVPQLGLALHRRPGGGDQADVGGQPVVTRTHQGAELEQVLFDAVVHGRGRTTLAGRDDRDEALAALKRVVRGTRDSIASLGARPVEPCLKHVPTGILVPGERFAVGVRKCRGSPVWYQEQAVEGDDYAAPDHQATFHEPFAFGIETTMCRVPSDALDNRALDRRAPDQRPGTVAKRTRPTCAGVVKSGSRACRLMHP